MPKVDKNGRLDISFRDRLSEWKDIFKNLDPSSVKLLDVFDCKISSFVDCPEMPNLVQWDIVENLVDTFAHCPNMPKLKKLRICENSIGSFKGCPCFPNMEFLNISANPIISFEYMPVFPKLETLIIPNTKIKSWDHFPELPCLKSINLTNSDIDEWTGDLPNFENPVMVYHGTWPKEKRCYILRGKQYGYHEFFKKWDNLGYFARKYSLQSIQPEKSNHITPEMLAEHFGSKLII